jgi:hypothetical protein
MTVHHTKNPRLMGGRYAAATGNADHGRQRQVAAPSDADIEQRLNDLVKPAVFAELDYYHHLGLRSRLLDLPVMVAIVLAMLWRNIPGVCALQRHLAQERILWAQPIRLSQSALSQRFLTFPAELFERVLVAVLERLPARWAARSRPVAPLLGRVRTRFAACYAVDGSTLEALFRKLQALQEVPEAPLAGHLAAVVDLVTRLRQKTSFTVQQVLVDRPQARDQIIHLGKHRSNPSTRPVRLIEVYVNGVWWRYLTNVLDPQRLSVLEVVALYQRRWQIETAFALVKGLLGLSYLWVGSLNGVQLQVWATWLYYAVLLDLCDEVAEALHRPLDAISVEMVSRSLYFYVQAMAQGYTDPAAQYFAENAQLLGIIKRSRPSTRPSVLTQVSLALDQDLTGLTET